MHADLSQTSFVPGKVLENLYSMKILVGHFEKNILVGHFEKNILVGHFEMVGVRDKGEVSSVGNS